MLSNSRSKLMGDRTRINPPLPYLCQGYLAKIGQARQSALGN
ncbi:hypothetical protein [Microcoleus sp. B4-D4]